MNKLLILIGIPGSGKSSLAARLVTECPQIQVISTDKIRAQLFGAQAVQGDWTLVWHQVGRQMQQAVEQSVEAVYDATNAARQHRRAAIALARTTGLTHITGLWLDTPLQACLERNYNRDRTVPEEVILRMHSSLLDAPPSRQDGFDDLIRYSLLRCGKCDRIDEKEPNSTNKLTLLP